MIVRLSLSATIILALLAPMLMSTVAKETVARANACEWQKGFSFWSPAGQYSTQDALASLARLKATGANYVAPVVTLYVDDAYDSTVERNANTPSDAELMALIDRAHALGLKVLLKIHVDSVDKTWRGFFDPADKQAWFASYSPLVEHYASLAANSRVEGLVIGSELIGLSGSQFTGHWKDMIAKVRARYSGFITYSANWGGGIADTQPDRLEEFTKIEFWPDLDYLGISAYFELSKAEFPAEDDLLRGWDRWFQSRIAPFQAAYGKPLLLTEIGYKSTTGAAGRPWDMDLEEGADLELQSRLYDAFFKFWSSVPWLHGVYFWRWSPQPADGGPLDTDYTPQNKPAENVVVAWFTRPNWLAVKRWALLDRGEPLRHKQEGPLVNVAMAGGAVRVWAFLGQLSFCHREQPATVSQTTSSLRKTASQR